MMNMLSTGTIKRASALSSMLMPVQNGVVDGSLYWHSSSGATSQIAGSSGNQAKGGAGTPPTRPKQLGVNDYHKSNIQKNRALDIDDEGSLPCTPAEMPSGCGADLSSCPSGDEVLDQDTRQLIEHFYRDYTELSQSGWKSKPLSTMKRVVDDVVAKHRYAYNGMLLKLGLDERGDDVSFVTSVAKNIFGDGVTNWGRIASLVAFGAVLCQYLKETGREDCIESVGQEISSYLLSDQRDWLVKNNSWNGFVEFFHVEDPESTVRKALMAVAGFAGIGATLALMIR